MVPDRDLGATRFPDSKFEGTSAQRHEERHTTDATCEAAHLIEDRASPRFPERKCGEVQGPREDGRRITNRTRTDGNATVIQKEERGRYQVPRQ